MKIEQRFSLDRPIKQVWAFFQDVPAVADCLPGAEYLGQGEGGKHNGKMSMKVGPFQSSFEGAAELIYDDEAYNVDMSGKGVDKRGASRGKLTMNCKLCDENGKTNVTINADLQLSGSIAQFGRTGIIHEIASTLIKDFVANVEGALPPQGAVAEMVSAEPSDDHESALRRMPQRSKPISGGRLLWLSLKSWVRSLFSQKS